MGAVPLRHPTMQHWRGSYTASTISHNFSRRREVTTIWSSVHPWSVRQKHSLSNQHNQLLIHLDCVILKARGFGSLLFLLKTTCCILCRLALRILDFSISVSSAVLAESHCWTMELLSFSTKLLCTGYVKGGHCALIDLISSCCLAILFCSPVFFLAGICSPVWYWQFGISLPYFRLPFYCNSWVNFTSLKKIGRTTTCFGTISPPFYCDWSIPNLVFPNVSLLQDYVELTDVRATTCWERIQCKWKRWTFGIRSGFPWMRWFTASNLLIQPILIILQTFLKL